VFENDYLMRIILQFVAAMQRAMRETRSNPEAQANDLEALVGNAVNMDSRLLFSLTPESLVSMLQIGDFDAKLGGYVLRSIYLEAELLDEAGQPETANLRREQADAIAKAYGFDVTIADIEPEALETFLDPPETEEDEWNPPPC